MATFEYTLPELGEGIEAGDVVGLLVKVGDVIQAEQPILELETDKAVVEVPSPVGGTVQALHVHTGDKIAVGQLLMTLDTAVATPAAPAAVAPTAVAVAPASTVHDTPAAREALPPSLPPPAPARATSDAPLPPPRAEAPAPPPVPVPASPSVRRLAREIGVDIAQVQGSGPGGRISEDDVKQHARQTRPTAAAPQSQRLPAEAPRAEAPVPEVALPDFATWGPVQRQAMSNVRRSTAEHMAHSWRTIPHVTQFDKADITELDALRQQYAARVEAAGGRLTVTAILLKALAAALKVFPQFNASVDMATHEIVYKQYYHIGVAVDTDRGLLVPVIRDVDRKSLITLAVELTQAAERARTRKTTREDMQGGTCTLTNLGGIGGSHFTPIINAPEVAILGVARSQLEPVYRDGVLVPRLLLPLALSYDHRVIDGAAGARFLRWLVEVLQQPFLLALEG